MKTFIRSICVLSAVGALKWALAAGDTGPSPKTSTGIEVKLLREATFSIKEGLQTISERTRGMGLVTPPTPVAPRAGRWAGVAPGQEMWQHIQFTVDAQQRLVREIRVVTFRDGGAFRTWQPPDGASIGNDGAFWESDGFGNGIVGQFASSTLAVGVLSKGLVQIKCADGEYRFPPTQWTATALEERSGPPSQFAIEGAVGKPPVRIPALEAPVAIAAESGAEFGALEVRLVGTDRIRAQATYPQPRAFVVPHAVWQEIKSATKEPSCVQEYLIPCSPSFLLTRVQVGGYFVGVETPFGPDPDGPSPRRPVLPPSYYAWDGWEESPMLQTREGKLYYSTWYPAWVERGRTALVVAIRMKQGSDVNQRLQQLRAADPPYTVSLSLVDEAAEDLINLLRSYGKAFVAEDCFLCLTHTEGGPARQVLKGEAAKKEMERIRTITK